MLGLKHVGHKEFRHMDMYIIPAIAREHVIPWTMRIPNVRGAIAPQRTAIFLIHTCWMPMRCYGAALFFPNHAGELHVYIKKEKKPRKKIARYFKIARPFSRRYASYSMLIAHYFLK
jgi:hypothetical protein